LHSSFFKLCEVGVLWVSTLQLRYLEACHPAIQRLLSLLELFQACLVDPSNWPG
jgi:hypothetical protein